ncbi:MAG: phosphohistidine phosphatase SixA, partial [Calditrichaeota bacterium]
MRVYLVQHGKSFSKEEDPERSLTPEGEKEVAGMAEWAARAGVAVAEIKHSGKTRARQTAEIFAANLHPEGGVREASGLNPLDDVVVFANQPGNLEEGVMLVGHLPFLERLTSFLITGSP